MNQKSLNELADDILSYREEYNSNAPYLARINSSLGATYKRWITNNTVLKELSELVINADKSKLLKKLEKYKKAQSKLWSCKNPNIDNLQNTDRYVSIIEKALTLIW